MICCEIVVDIALFVFIKKIKRNVNKCFKRIGL